MYEKRCVSLLQFVILVINVSFGANMLTLPRNLAEQGKESMWLIVLLGSILIISSFWIATKICRYFPKQGAIEYHQILLGRFAGTILNFYLLVLMLLIISTILRIFTIAVKGFLLDLTPPQVIVSIVLLVTVYVCQSGLGPLLRFQQFVSESSYSLFIIIMLIGILAVETKNFEPFLAQGILPVLKGVPDTWLPYTGPEILVGFFYPYLTARRDVFKFGLYGIGAVTLLYVVLTAIVQGVLGAAETAHLLIPTVMAYRAVEIPGTFIERLDGYFMIVWIAIAFISIVNWLYMISLGISQMLKLETTRPVSLFLVPVILYVASVPPDIQAVFNLQTQLSQ